MTKLLTIEFTTASLRGNFVKVSSLTQIILVSMSATVFRCLLAYTLGFSFDASFA
jgi:hypothetical protein